MFAPDAFSNFLKLLSKKKRKLSIENQEAIKQIENSKDNKPAIVSAPKVGDLRLVGFENDCQVEKYMDTYIVTGETSDNRHQWLVCEKFKTVEDALIYIEDNRVNKKVNYIYYDKK